MVVKTRMTKQKKMIHDALAKQNSFLSAQALHDILAAQGESIGLATVYRIVQNMVDDGMLDSLNLGGTKTLYRLCTVEEHHHHLVCTHCGMSIEFEAPAIEKEATSIAQKHNFTDVKHSVEIFGLCPKCQNLK
ncbi:MAG: Fur family transcriptional regulator [Micrococcaceae bacterium]